MYNYYIDGKKFTTDNWYDIPWDDISSPDEKTPTLEDLSDGYRSWCEIGRKFHRLTGPARTWSNGQREFWLNGIYYENVKNWLKDHPNQDNAFQIEMLLKYS
jgi:hypothetical protein